MVPIVGWLVGWLVDGKFIATRAETAIKMVIPCSESSVQNGGTTL